MYLEEDDLVVSPTDMVAFTACTHVTWLDRLAAAGRIERPDRDDPMLELLRGRGQDHETRYLQHLRDLGLDVADVAEHRGTGGGGDGALTRRDRLRGRAEATRTAMQSGQDIVFQATFLDESHSPNWRGHADFLRRVETPSGLGGWSYEPEDTKLARLLKASAVLQLAVYAEQIAEVQGRPPESIHVVLGDMARASIRLDEVAAYHRMVRSGFEAELARTDEEYPIPTTHCGVCRWVARCKQRWEADDHLSRVAFITRENVRRLEEAGITTLAALATSPPEPVPAGVTATTFARLRSQAALQHRRTPGAPPPWEFVLTEEGQVEENRGLAALPPPDPGDLFYDIEGHPYAVDGGLEYLHGVGWVEDGEFVFEGGWAHDPRTERRVFEQLIDHIVERRRAHPGMHVYHYAPYETTAIGKLMGRYGTREQEVDTLLREDVFVDLYRVVRQGLRIGSESYSIKKLEPLYMRPREGDIGTGGSSIVEYERWLHSGDPAILKEIEDYNRDDVESTVLLRGWLEERRRDLEAAGVEVPRPESLEPESTGWEDEELDDLLERLAGDRDEPRPGGDRPSSDEYTQQVPVTTPSPRAPGDPETSPPVVSTFAQPTDPASEPPITAANELPDEWTTASSGAWTPAGSVAAGDDETAARWLLADLLQWHRREDKPEWWRYFARIHDYEPNDFIDDIETVGGLQLEGVVEQVRRSYVWRYRFDPDQDCKLTPGNIVMDPDHARALAAQGLGRKTSTVHDVDPTAGTIDIIRSTQWDGPHPGSLAPSGPLSTTALRAALRYVANALLDHGVDGPGPARAARQLLARRRPEIIGSPAGAPLRLPSESAGDAAIRVVGSLDHSYLPVQGPPGSGKTYSAADVVLDLVERGQRVGITAFTHHAITNLIEEIAAHAHDRGLTPRILQKTTVGKRAADDDLVTLVTKPDDVVDDLTSFDIIAGTAWLWAREDLRASIDTLIVDEAGQLSLANVVAVSTSCRNLVLVGDPQQLSQPSKGVHPEGAGATALEHVLRGRRTVPPDRGLLLDRTWRMHPEVCAFISEQVYEGRLTSQEHLNVQRIGGDDSWAGAGLRWVPVHHQGNRTSSTEEIDVIGRIVQSLLGRPWIDDTGTERTLGTDDILVVAPYNAQVHRLATALPPGSRVGTVDSFQGQEAAVAILSMTTSSAEDAPRGMDFLYSTNRINVAVSRARALSIVVGSPDLLSAPCSSVGQIRMVNVLCRYAELARAVHASAA